jgi:VanZ family protein
MPNIRARQAVSVWWPVVAYMGFIFWLSAQSSLPTPPGILGWDKLEHSLAYMVMGLLLIRTSRGSRMMWVQTMVIGALYGASDEWHQSFVPGRSMSIYDWVADIVGLLTALALYSIYLKIRANGGKQND